MLVLAFATGISATSCGPTSEEGGGDQSQQPTADATSVAIVGAPTINAAVVWATNTATAALAATDAATVTAHLVGLGVTLRHAAGATVEEGGEMYVQYSPGHDPKGMWRVLGPRVPPGVVGYPESEGPRPAYELYVSAAPNPGVLDPCSWARASVLDARATAEAEGGPPGGLPIDASGKVEEDLLRVTMIGGVPACRVTYNQFDSLGIATYAAVGDRILVFRYTENISANVPIAARQLAAYEAILATVRFED